MIDLGQPPQSAQVEIGTVGWDDEAEAVDKGSSTDDGHTLVRVTLYRGRDITKPAPEGVADGMKLLCVLADGIGIPPKGARCYVLLPAGMELTPGAGVVTCTVSPGLERFDNLGGGVRQFTASEGQARVIAKRDGSLTLYTTASNERDGDSVYLRVAPDGLNFVAPWGTLRFDATGWHVRHVSGASYSLGGIYGMPFPLDQLTSYFRVQAAIFKGQATTQTFGAGVTPDPLASATEAAAALSALQTQISLIMTAVSAIQADPTHVASATATTTAATGVTNGSSTVSAAVAALPTSTSSS